MKTDSFALRHLGPRENDVTTMLDTIGVETLDQLIYETIPSDIRLKNPLELEHIMTEYEYANHIRV
jgi:glycine dehydrogenase